MEKLWYVVNTYSGHEYKVKEKLESKIESMGLQDNIFRIVIPETTEVEVKDGVQKEHKKKMFPGYILVEMNMSDESWYIVRNTPGVTGFIGSSGKGAKPTPLLPQEIDKILSNMGMSRVNLESEMAIGDKVNIGDKLCDVYTNIDNYDSIIEDIHNSFKLSKEKVDVSPIVHKVIKM